MKNSVLILLLTFLIASCQTGNLETRKSKYEPMANFLPYVNEKVTGYLQNSDNSDNLDGIRYKNIIEQVCFPLPRCGRNAKIMFQTYQVKVRQVGKIFTVMLCDIGGAEKIMEAFSCNENATDIRSYEKEIPEPCEFETKEVVDKYCPSK